MSSPSPVVIGHGPNRVLAFHGWFGSSKGWGPFLDFIDRDQFTYALVDYRGYGERKEVSGDYTISEISRDALQAADELGWDRFNLLGHSMGGLAAQHVLKDAPQRVLRLAALSGVPATGAQFDDETYALFDKAANDDEVRAQLTHYSTGFRLNNTFLKRIVDESRTYSTVDAFGGHLPSWVRTDISKDVTGLEHPVKAIVGEHDPSMNAEVMKVTWLKFYPNAELEVIPNAGHYAMYETPVWLATTLEKFFLGESTDSPS
ncbi:alpha/beta fold hydrolase [Mycolicibacterium thermoresistibile]|uniref:Alpha/beta hydrolase n=1 Tax=Mycolicibacterium thermoresistibile TaxID=1797 RepID=A0A117IM67_MYCTH|nr:alpha/beta hydrolase [Mycolicibacterium thermoresistibile]MCV7188959.1 alpha/beta hydrolase [Mycolicibacterium thermoresistibile]GAT14856.1 alpha/beta hydrolase [Mycolicibacterium thermoresistibile]SNW20079.1 putative hydrolase or acyltransferase of alpha/beta superfamily [Mycolicibacterium thermoresistibile]